MKNKPLLYHTGLFAVSFIYGINYSTLKSITPAYLPAFGFIIFRIFIAGSVFWLLSLGKSERIDWKSDGWRLFFSALTGVTINQLCFFKGISLTSAINASIFMTLSPVFVFVFAIIFLKDRLKWYRVGGLIMALSGALLLVYQPGAKITSGNWMGDLFILINGISWAIYLIIVKPLMAKYSSMTINKWVFLIGFFPALPIGLSEAMTIDWSAIPLWGWGAFAYAILGATVTVYLLNNWTLKYVSASMVGIYIYVQPIIATTVAIVFSGEHFTLNHFLSSLLVFSGIYQVTKR